MASVRSAVSRPLMLSLGPPVALACSAGWHQPPSLTPGPLPPRQQVQVWQHGAALRWHRVQVSSDSISGIPFFQSIACDTCRATVARTEVDSLRFGNPVAAFWKSVGLVTASVVGLG